MNGFDLKEMTSWKKENDMCVYVDNSVDLVDFSCFSTKKATSVSNLSTEKKCRNRFIVLNQSMTGVTKKTGETGMLSRGGLNDPVPEESCKIMSDK